MSTDDKPKPRTYRPGNAVMITIAVFLGSQIIGATLFGFVLLLFPGNSDLTGAAIEQKLLGNPGLYLGLIATIDVIAVWAITGFMKRINMSWKDIGFGRFLPSHLSLAAVGYVISFVTSVVVLSALAAIFSGVDFNQEQSLGIASDVSGVGLVPMFVALVVLPPLVEELIMRGFLYTNLRKWLSFEWTTVIVSTIFGLAHITQVDDGLFVSGAISFFVLSVVLCWLREKTGSIWSSIGLHAIQNGVAFLVLYVWQVA